MQVIQRFGESQAEHLLEKVEVIAAFARAAEILVTIDIGVKAGFVSIIAEGGRIFDRLPGAFAITKQVTRQIAEVHAGFQVGCRNGSDVCVGHFLALPSPTSLVSWGLIRYDGFKRICPLPGLFRCGF